jgi:hypothetical protein
MRFIPTRYHGLIDYLVGLALIAAPWLFGFVPDDSNAWSYETYTPIVLGSLLIVQSIFTNYEWGVFKYINMPNHLYLDIVSGIVLAASPWLFGFADYVYGPHLVVGLAEIVIALCTKRAPERSTPNLTVDHTGYTMPSRS